MTESEQNSERFPRLIYNSDGDSTTLLAFDSPISPEQACRDIEEMVGTKVDVFCNSMGRGDETFSHPSEFGEIYGAGVTEWPEGENVRWVRIMAENTRALLDAGINIVELLAERAHKRGLQFWPTLRMNDIHEDDSTRFAAFRSTYKKNHPELLIGSPYPKKRGYGYPQDNFTWAFDFAREEVRKRKLGLILETCEKYDVDGFELDFQRGPWYFKEGKVREGIPLMTDFMRKVRKGISEIMTKRGRPFILMLRVPPTVEKCLEIGLDVPAWIKEELGDIFVLMDGGYLDMGADIAGFVKMARGTKCRIGGGLERLSKGYGYAGNDMLYAAASSFWHQGASCIYLFNYDCHRKLGWSRPYSPAEIKLLKEIHDPKIILRRDKRYCVSVDLGTLTPEENGRMPLPVEIRNSGDRKVFTIWVGDDLDSAKQDGALKDMWLRLTFAKGVDEKEQVVIRLNGKKLSAGHRIDAPACVTWQYTVSNVVRGKNEISVSIDKMKPDEALRVEGIELVINYGG